MNIYKKYGEYYDIIYSAKNYKGECEAIEQYFQRFSKRNTRSILDVGCGTGTHCIILAKKGYLVSGVDLSGIMIEQARRKAEKHGLKVSFYIQDMRRLNLEKKFDAVLCLFGSLGYCTTDTDLKDTLTSIGKHLKKDGLFIFDFWPIFAYASREHWQSVREAEEGNISITRIMDCSMNLENNVIKLKIKCFVMKNQTFIESFDEEHEVRAFSIPEMKHFLEENGFKPLGFFKANWAAQLPYTLKKVDVKTLNVACVATIL